MHFLEIRNSECPTYEFALGVEGGSPEFSSSRAILERIPFDGGEVADDRGCGNDSCVLILRSLLAS